TRAQARAQPLRKASFGSATTSGALERRNPTTSLEWCPRARYARCRFQAIRSAPPPTSAVLTWVILSRRSGAKPPTQTLRESLPIPVAHQEAGYLVDIHLAPDHGRVVRARAPKACTPHQLHRRR